MPNRWNCPFLGLGFFLTHPRLWGWALLGVLISSAATIAICSYVISTTYPTPFYFWTFMQSMGWGLLALVLMVAIVFPIVFTGCLGSALAKEAGRKGQGSWISSFTVFFRTLGWRVFWPVLLLVCILFLPLLVIPLSLLAVNHLAILEGVDLALTIYGKNANERVEWIRSHGSDCLAAALSGSFLLFILSFILIGWVVWIPAMYCGTYLWVRNEIQKTS